MKSEKCPFCEKGYVEREALYAHIEKEHPEKVSEDMSAARLYFNERNKKTHGTCVICGEESPWNEATERYERFCSDRCRAVYREEFSKRMMDRYGKTHLLDDPDQQKKMLGNRSISGVYKWSTGGETPYTGSYEHDFLRFLDLMMGFRSTDVMAPAPQVFYYMDGGKKRFYIPDFYIPSINALVEVKDGGDNPNMHHNRQDVDGRKEKIKDDMMRKQKQYNFVKVPDKNYSTFLKFLTEVKNEYADMKKREAFPIVLIEENFNFLESALLEMHAGSVPTMEKMSSERVNAADFSKGNEWSLEKKLSDPTLANQWIGAYVDSMSQDDEVDLVMKLKAVRKNDQIGVQESATPLELASDFVSGLYAMIAESADEMPGVAENNIDRQDAALVATPEIHEALDKAPKVWLATDWHMWSPNVDDEKTQACIDNQIRMVGPRDVFIYLGDWVDDDCTAVEKLRLKKVMRSLSGGVKIMIYGNNDIESEEFYRQGGFDHVLTGLSWGRYAFSHYPLQNKKGHEINIHGHLHGGPYYNARYDGHADVYSYREGCKPVELREVVRKFEAGLYAPPEHYEPAKYSNRLLAMKQRKDPDNILGEAAVVIEQETVDHWKCPHCMKRIGEKSLMYDDGRWIHRECGGQIELPSAKRGDMDGIMDHIVGESSKPGTSEIKELTINKRKDGKESWICPKCNKKISGDYHLFRSKGVFKHACGIMLRLPNEDKKKQEEKVSEAIERMYMMSPLVSLDGADDLLREDFDVDADGTMLISLREKSDFMSKYNTSHRLMKLYRETGNVEGVKHELCKMWYMYIIIERYYGRGGKDPLFYNKERHQADALKAKAFILNDFTNGLKWVMEREPAFNFDAYFRETPYNKDVVKLDTGKIRGIKKIVQAIAKPI